MLPHHFKQVNAMASVTLAAVAKQFFSDRSTQVYSLLLAVTLSIYMVGALNVAPEVFSSTSMPDVSAAIMWCAFGWFLYLVQEYISHVWIFHMSPPKSLNGYRLLYRLHMGHHDRPKRLDILATPMWFTFPILLLNAALMVMLAPTAWIACLLLLGLLSGYLMFEWFHLLVHTPYPLRNSWLRFIQQRHLAHHYKNENRWFTVTPLGSLIDDLMGTGGSVDRATSSKNPRNGTLEPTDPRVLFARQYYSSQSDGTPEESELWLGTASNNRSLSHANNA